MKPHPGEVATGSPVAQRDVNSTKEAGSPQQGAAPAQEWRSPGGGQALPDMLERAASLLLSGLDTLRDDLLAAAEYLRAPTPEFIAGWLAGREKSAGLVKAEFGDRLARRIRALAPPSAPPVQPASGGNRRAAKNDAPSLTASEIAVRYILNRRQTDPDLGYLIGSMTESFDLLCRAEAETTGKPINEVASVRRRDLQPEYRKRQAEVVTLRKELETLRG